MSQPERSSSSDSPHRPGSVHSHIHASSRSRSPNTNSSETPDDLPDHLQDYRGFLPVPLREPRKAISEDNPMELMMVLSSAASQKYRMHHLVETALAHFDIHPSPESGPTTSVDLVMLGPLMPVGDELLNTTVLRWRYIGEQYHHARGCESLCCIGYASPEEAETNAQQERKEGEDVAYVCNGAPTAEFGKKEEVSPGLKQLAESLQKNLQVPRTWSIVDDFYEDDLHWNATEEDTPHAEGSSGREEEIGFQAERHDKGSIEEEGVSSGPPKRRSRPLSADMAFVPGIGPAIRTSTWGPITSERLKRGTRATYLDDSYFRPYTKPEAKPLTQRVEVASIISRGQVDEDGMLVFQAPSEVSHRYHSSDQGNILARGFRSPELVHTATQNAMKQSQQLPLFERDLALSIASAFLREREAIRENQRKGTTDEDGWNILPQDLPEFQQSRWVDISDRISGLTDSVIQIINEVDASSEVGVLRKRRIKDKKKELAQQISRQIQNSITLMEAEANGPAV